MTAARTWIPLSRWVPFLPAGQFDGPSLDDVAVVDFAIGLSAGALRVTCTLSFATDLSFGLPGVDDLELLLLSDGDDTRVTAEAMLGADLSVTLRDLRASLRLPGGLLVPVTRAGPSAPWEPVPGSLTATFDVDVAMADGDGRVVLEPPPALTLTPFMIGETGIVVEASGIGLVLSDADPPPAGQATGFRGVTIAIATVHLPPAFALDLAPDAISATGLVIGTGGVSGVLTGTWQPSWSGTTPSGDGAGTLAGLPFALDSLSLELAQNSVIGAAIAGRLAVPFFDAVLDVDVAVSVDGTVSLAVRADDGLLTLDIPALGSLTVAAVGLDGDALLLSGDLQPEIGAPALSWPTVTVEDLRVNADGTVEVPGGWLTLQQPLALDLYGFGLEITRIGFGTEDDGRRWFGVDGALRLTDLLPAGASARGLRVLWHPDRPSDPPALALEGVGVFFGIPDTFAFEGEVALADDPATGLKLFTGELSLGLDALDIGIDAGITVGRDRGATYVFLHLGVSVPIPVAATGTALYGLEGLFAMNMAPLVSTGDVVVDADTTIERGDWYGWYKAVDERFSVTDPSKWTPELGGWAFGAGLSLGTLPDAGFSVNTKALLVVLLPGPVILLQGTADLFKVPAAFGEGNAEEGTFRLLAAIDGRAGTLQLGIDAEWTVPRLLEIAASTEAFFDFDRMDAWHVWLGREEPESMRIRADILSLFHADSWLMLDAKGVGTGLSVSFGDTWRFGPVRLTLGAWIGATAGIATRPAQLTGALDLGGECEIAAGPFGLGLSVGAGLEGDSFAPFRVAGTLSVSVGLPTPLKDLDVDITLEWSQPEQPVIADPWVGAVVEHERCTESWTPVAGADLAAPPDGDAPVVPLDAGVLLTFAQPMGDEARVADNPPAGAPTVAIGAHVAAYTLVDLRLHRWRRTHPAAGWEDLTDTVVATWTPDASTRLQLLARSPFAFTRSTSRRWVDSFLEGQVTWPCSMPPPAVRTCIDWNDWKPNASLPRIWEQGGATLSSEGDLIVDDRGDGTRAIALRWAPAPDGTPQPGILWIGLPEPAVEVTAEVEVSLGDWVALRGWSGSEQVGVDWALPGTVLLRVAGDSIDAATIGWGFNVEPQLLRLCWVPKAASDAIDTWSAGQESLETAAERWASVELVLDPESHYRIEVTTRAVLTEGGREVDRVDGVHAVQFQTGGPPGIVPSWVPPMSGFPREGVLRDLTPYVARSIPDPGAVPVFRAYDLGCEFATTTVQQMYGADLLIRLPGGTFANAWEEGPATTLTTSEATWLSRLDACTGAVEWTGLAGDDHVRAQVPGLLYDDFSGTLGTVWQAVVLDPAETRAANWHLDSGVLRQDVAVGTSYVAGGVSASDVAVETVAWASTGVFGLVFRWRGSGDYYRFTLGTRRQRLVRVDGAVETELWSAAGAYEPGVPTPLAVQAQGGAIRCQVGEQLICDILEDVAGIAGSVGLYAASSTDAAFDEVRARPWPGTALEPASACTAELLASRPVFTDAFSDLAAFDPVTLGDGQPVDTCSASRGTATIAAPRGETVVALAGDPAAADYVVECTARADADGMFGLVVRHDGRGRHVALQLTAGGGRSLVSYQSGLGRVLWIDSTKVVTGATYALSLRCEGTQITVGVDGVEVTRTVSTGAGRFGLLSGVVGKGCAFTDLVVRSAPRVPVHHWNLTTSRYLGLPDMLDTFAGTVWPLPSSVGSLAAAATAASTALTAAQGAVAAARTEVAAADPVELAGLAEAARAAVAALHGASAASHDSLVAALGTPWRPVPPIVELSSVGEVALLLDLPEPLPWERMTWSLEGPGSPADVVLAWSADGARAILVRAGAAPFAAGAWTLRLALHLDVGPAQAKWRRGGSSLPEAGSLRFSL
ncbi:hypothetical protein [Actinoplanes sp. NPDC049599]|uniref:hypothetical protein n=1 Tax=Actinoplanes sp. NPDC049599 TaxID=3363903 RepID=UPI003798EEDB